MKKTLVLALSALIACACSKKKSGADAAQPVPVTVTPAVIKSVPVSLEATGTVTPIKSVTITAQVEGKLQKIYIKEGQKVSQGELLMLIDPLPFQQDLDKAVAQLAQDTDSMNFAQIQASRYKDLVAQGAAAQADLDQFETNYKVSAAKVDSDNAAINQAKINLGYTKIIAPFSGKVGSFLVNEGAVVKKNDTQLIVLNMLSPIYVQFSVPEKYLHAFDKQRVPALKISAQPDGGPAIAGGQFAFVDNAVNSDTGMMLLKASFPNKDYALWPGEFAKVTVALDKKTEDTVVPAASLQSSQDGQYIFVVRPDNTVSQRKVAVDRTVGDDCVVTSGVSAGEQVVTDGQMLLKDGSPVQIKTGADK